MRFVQTGNLGRSANRAAGDFAARVDSSTGDVASRAAGVIALAVRVLRLPTAVLAWAPVPFELATLALALSWAGAARVVGVVLALAMGLVSAAFAGRRHKVVRAADDPDKLATELGIAVSLSDKVGETRGALEQIAGGGGWRVFSRAKGLWRGAGMTGRWIGQVGDLPRAKYFVPPKIGTTVTVTVAALWLVPISVLVAFFALVGTVAGSF